MCCLSPTSEAYCQDPHYRPHRSLFAAFNWSNPSPINSRLVRAFLSWGYILRCFEDATSSGWRILACLSSQLNSMNRYFLLIDRKNMIFIIPLNTYKEFESTLFIQVRSSKHHDVTPVLHDTLLRLILKSLDVTVLFPASNV